MAEESRKGYVSEVLGWIRDISDIDYQVKSWVNGEVGCGFDETVNHYSEDMGIISEDYEKYELTQSQYKILKEFYDKFDDFQSNYEMAFEFIATPEWAKIVEMAKGVLKIFNYEKES